MRYLDIERKDLSHLVKKIAEKYGKEEVIVFYKNFYSINIEEFKEEYLINKKGFSTISREKNIPYKIIKLIFEFYFKNQIRTFSESIKLQNEKNKLIFKEKYGVENSFQLDFVKEKCQSKEVREKADSTRKKTMLEKYGVENSFQLDFVKEKCQSKEVREKRAVKLRETVKTEEYKIKKRNSLIKYSLEKYGTENPFQDSEVKKKCNTEEVIKKAIKTKIKNKKMTDISEESTFFNWRNYRILVRRLTRSNYIKHKDIVNPKNYKISREDYSIDHKISIFEGFDKKIPAEIIASHLNLQMITFKENLKKGIKISYDYKLLIEEYNDWKNKEDKEDKMPI